MLGQRRGATPWLWPAAGVSSANAVTPPSIEGSARQAVIRDLKLIAEGDLRRHRRAELPHISVAARAVVRPLATPMAGTFCGISYSRRVLSSQEVSER